MLLEHGQDETSQHVGAVVEAVNGEVVNVQHVVHDLLRYLHHLREKARGAAERRDKREGAEERDVKQVTRAFSS